MCYCRNTGWNGYQKESQHRKFTLENKILSPEMELKQIVRILY